MEEPASSREKARAVAHMLEEHKGEDTVILDLTHVSSFTDYFVITTAQSKAQCRAICDTILRELKHIGVHKLGQEGNAGGQWVLLDYGGCVVHVFSPALREYYALESLWGDAPNVTSDFTEEAESPRNARRKKTS